MSLFPETPKLESRNCPEIVPGGVPGLWELITPDCEVWLRRGLNQTCSPRRDLFNDVSQSQFGGREEVDSWLLMVGSQTAGLTPGPSFAHNLGYRCSNDQCEAIFYIYASRPFQWHQEHLNASCFGPCCRALNIRESRRIPNPHFFQVLGFTPTLGQSRVATGVTCGIVQSIIWYHYLHYPYHCWHHLYHCWHYLYHYWHFRWFHLAFHHFFCPYFYAFLFPLHSWAWGSSFLNFVIHLKNTYWRMCYNLLSIFQCCLHLLPSSFNLGRCLSWFSFWCINIY